MPRLPRNATHVPGQITHVISRFVDGRFVLDDGARARYLLLLERALRASDWSLISYALMSSHIHLGLLTGAAELRTWILPLHVRFAQWINRRLRPTNPKVLGHVFADRPTTKVMRPSRARVLMAYHHRNPFEAGVVQDLDSSTWTSQRAYMGLARSEGGLNVPLGLSLGGFEDSASGRWDLHAFTARTECAFDQLQAEERPVRAVCPERARSGASPEEVVRRAAMAVGVPLEKVMRASRERQVVLVRRVALVAGLERGLRAGEMARALSISESAASRLLSRPHEGSVVRAGVERVLSSLANAA